MTLFGSTLLLNWVILKYSGGTYQIVKKYKLIFLTRCHYRRLLLRILYFGWNYQGLAVQEDSTQTIEHHLFNALKKSCLIESREKSQYHRCGRTDKGVSAFGQVLILAMNWLMNRLMFFEFQLGQKRR